MEKIFFDTKAAYEQYGDKATFIQGKASSWDEKARVVTIENADGRTETISYWALILATGSKTDSPLFSLQGASHTNVEDALRSLHDRLGGARDVVIVGGGPAGVETAGEIGEALNGAAGWFSSRPANPKAKVTLLTGSDKLLPLLRKSIAGDAETYLNRVGVDVRYNVRALSAEPTSNGKTKLTLSNGEELRPDVYIPAMGVRPMSEYVPQHLKDEKGYVLTDNTMRVEGAGPRVYALGDVGSYSRDTILDIFDSLPVMITNLKRDLLAAHSNSDGNPEGPDRLYTRSEKETQVVPVGRSKGVGAAFGWRVPSFLVWLIKGRDYMISRAYQNIDGSAFAKEVIWTS